MMERRDENPLGLGPRDRESSNSGSTDDTSYAAADSDPNPAGEPPKDASGSEPARQQGRRVESQPADPETTSSDEP